MSTITHFVAFRYKPTTSDAEKRLVGSSFLALQDQCEHPQRGGQYLTVTGGRNNSPEGFAKGCEVRVCISPHLHFFTPTMKLTEWMGRKQHAWVVTFASEEDRAYYLDHDPAHLKFKELAGQHVEDLFVFDFEQGVF